MASTIKQAKQRADSTASDTDTKSENQLKAFINM